MRRMTPPTTPTTQSVLPHATAFSATLIFGGVPLKEKDADHHDADDKAAERAAESRWDNASRPAWERHSEKGTNLEPQGYRISREVLQDVVNPLDHDYEYSNGPLRQEHWDQIWAKLDTTSSLYEDKTLTK